MQQDYRALYLAWLKAITLLDVDEEEYEPPVPLGLRKLSRSLSAFVELFEVDEYLLEVAAKSSGEQRSISDDTLLQAITKLSREECNAFLLRLANGEPHLSLDLKKELSELIAVPQPESEPQRTIKQLFEGSEQERKQAEIRKKQELEAERIQELQVLAKREANVWKDVEVLLQKSQAKAYDEAVQLLLKLQDLAIYQGKKPAFQEHMLQIYNQYSRRTAFIKRLRDVGLNQQ